jgi:hypothetical protein
MSCQNSAETEILLDHAVRTVGATHQPAQGPHGHRAPLKSTAYDATGAGQSGTVGETGPLSAELQSGQNPCP